MDNKFINKEVKKEKLTVYASILYEKNITFFWDQSLKCQNETLKLTNKAT